MNPSRLTVSPAMGLTKFLNMSHKFWVLMNLWGLWWVLYEFWFTSNLDHLASQSLMDISLDIIRNSWISNRRGNWSKQCKINTSMLNARSTHQTCQCITTSPTPPPPSQHMFLPFQQFFSIQWRMSHIVVTELTAKIQVKLLAVLHV